MQGDNTRETFNPLKHYQQVRMQQGRVQTDADWNEQSALSLRREEATATDLIGDCGGPADEAAFGILTDANKLPPAVAAWFNALAVAQRDAIKAALLAGDFLLSPGRYYVDGVQCELEEPALYSQQPDRLDVAVPAAGTHQLVYLDVWQRHLTALNDPAIRETALGGPDTATRVKTVWQVKLLGLGHGIILGDPCHSGDAAFKNLADPGTAKLTADTEPQAADDDPCLVPAGAGFTGLENQLYRVEIHNPGAAIDADTAASVQVTLPGAGDLPNTIRVQSGAWNANDAVEIFTNTAKMKGTLAWITGVGGAGNHTLTLDRPVGGFVQADNPRLRRADATWKCSRENASVVTAIEKIAANKITVASLGQDEHLGFAKDAWVEILDDKLELDGQPGQIAQIDDVDVTNRVITLKTPATPLDAANPSGVNLQRHPILRRWEFVGAVRFVNTPADNWIALESGIRIRFAGNGDYLTGHYWQIPARTATASSPAGDIEWPRVAGQRIPQPPRGIVHHLCRLGIFSPNAAAPGDVIDCRCLYSPLTHPELRSVGGDGQEVMPDLTPPNQNLLVPLPQPISVYVRNLQCTGGKLKLQFKVTPPSDKLILQSAPTNVSNAQGILDVPAAVGIVGCEWRLDPQVQPLAPRKVEVSLIDASNQTLASPPPIFFTANLSIASQVAYDPAGCAALQGKKTVQTAIARLGSLIRLEAVGGDGQDAKPGSFLIKPIRVLVTSSCGPVAGATVRFDTGGNQGVVTRLPPNAPPPGPTCDVVTGQDGIAIGLWRPDPERAAATQELTATLVPPDSTAQPGTLRFTANLRESGCCVTVGQGGEFEDLKTAIMTLIEGQADEICICLLPGDHEVHEMVITGVAHVNIHGCGRASRILVRNLFEARELRSITLQDLCIYVDEAKNRPIYINSCADVTITGCHVRNQDTGNRAPTDLLTIGHATKPVPPRRVHVANNLIECQGTLSPIVIDPGFVAPGEGFTAGSPTVVETALSHLASKSKSQRAAFVKKFRKIVKDTPKSDPKKGLLEAALKRVAASPRSTKGSKTARSIAGPSEAATTTALPLAATPEDLAAAVTGPDPIGLPPPLPIFFGPALVIADADAELMIVNNIIKGEVRLYGMQKRFEPAAFIHFANEIRDLQLNWAPTPNDAKIEGNSLTEIAVDEEAEPVPLHHHGTLSGIFNRLSILNNTFSSSFPRNQWLAANVISNGNHFVPGARDLGIAVGASLICIGTSADYNPSTGGEGGQPGAYLQYVVYPDRERFRECANLITLTLLGQIPQ